MKVISYSLWGNDRRYIDPLLNNLDIAKNIFSDWKIVVYVSHSLSDKVKQELREKGADIYECGESPDSRGMFWRFRALSLEQVEVVIIRDSDSVLTLRDRAIVDCWLESDRDLYLCRDHPFHCKPIIGCSWGARGNGIRQIESIAHFDPISAEYGDDEKFLAQMVYLKHRKDFLVFAPFLNYRGENNADFLRPRESFRDYVGRVDSEESFSSDARMKLVWDQLTPKKKIRYLIPYTRSWKMVHWLGRVVLRRSNLKKWRDFSGEV